MYDENSGDDDQVSADQKPDQKNSFQVWLPKDKAVCYTFTLQAFKQPLEPYDIDIVLGKDDNDMFVMELKSGLKTVLMGVPSKAKDFALKGLQEAAEKKIGAMSTQHLHETE